MSGFESSRAMEVEPKSEARVQAEIQRLREALDQHLELLDRLADRLSPVSGARSDAPGRDSQPEEIVCALAEDIRGAGRMVVSASIRVKAMVANLQI